MATGLNTGCSFRGVRLESQPGNSQPSGTPAPGDPTPSSGFHSLSGTRLPQFIRYQSGAQTHQTEQPYT